jgi:hypothetical protein
MNLLFDVMVNVRVNGRQAQVALVVMLPASPSLIWRVTLFAKVEN